MRIPQDYLRAVATFWVMSLVGIYPGRASMNEINIRRLMGLLQLAVTWYMLEGKLSTGTSKTKKIQIYLDEVALFWMSQWAISYPESSGFLVSGWAPVETLGNSKKLLFIFFWLPCNDFHCFTAEIQSRTQSPGQRMGASRDSGVLEFSYRKISAVKWKSLQGS